MSFRISAIAVVWLFVSAKGSEAWTVRQSFPVATTGRLGEDYDVSHGYEAAERCGVMLIAQMKKALGSLDRVERIVRLGAFVASDPHFTEQPQVANGASELMEKVFGEAGRHARAAVGVPVLPLGAAVEVDAIVAVKGD